MNILENYLITHFETDQLSERFGMRALEVNNEQWLLTAITLKEHPDLCFNQLVCESVTDRGDKGFELFGHLRSYKTGEELVLVTYIGKEHEVPEIESLAGIWGSAELFEDEIYDLFGIKFNNHPFLRRIMLGEDFEGYPLRKSYKFPENE
ncbi:MAG: NADH-quinone oxidoreductase subunit C [Bacteroidales bacterium]